MFGIVEVVVLLAIHYRINTDLSQPYIPVALVVEKLCMRQTAVVAPILPAVDSSMLGSAWLGKAVAISVR